MTSNCNESRHLIPAYLDGELSEAQAGPLRQHLLDCRDCRSGAQDGKSLRGWFVAEEADDLVPPGFAAHVARRAFAGATGEAATEPVGALPAAVRGRHLDFVLQLTAAAAAVLLVLVAGLRMQELPSGDRLRADDRSPAPVEEILEELETLNAEEPAPADGTGR